eukprot:6458717-Amphidinium_carterae.2
MGAAAKLPSVPTPPATSATAPLPLEPDLQSVSSTASLQAMPIKRMRVIPPTGQIQHPRAPTAHKAAEAAAGRQMRWHK